MQRIVSAKKLKQLMLLKLNQLGICQQHAGLISEGLITTSLRGIDTHGLRLFPLYVKEFEQGRCNISPNFHWLQNRIATSLLDADGANGIVAGSFAMDKAMELASKAGIGSVVVKNGNHFSAASIYTLQAMRKGYIALCMSNSDALVGLENTKVPFLGTNPIAFSAPGTNGKFFDLDMATSQVSFSKILNLLSNEQNIESSWAVKKNDSEDNDYVLSPLGGYKGQGLGMMVQIFTALLANMPFDNQLSHLYSEPYDQPRQISYTMICIDPEAFIDSNVFRCRVDEFLAKARAQSEQVIIAGDKEKQNEIYRTKSGIPVSELEYNWIEELAKNFNVGITE